MIWVLLGSTILAVVGVAVVVWYDKVEDFRKRLRNKR